MHYTVYKTTNLVNGKFYIGKHQTKNLLDGYFGSGKKLLADVAKFGFANFKTELLGVFRTEHEMNLAERILVVCDPEVSYNLCPGGHVGWSYLKSIKNHGGWKLTEYKLVCKNCKCVFIKKAARTFPETKFCSRSCSGKFVQKSRKLDNKSRAKVSRSLINYHKNKSSVKAETAKQKMREAHARRKNLESSSR